MINHVRTLLLNQPDTVAGLNSGIPGAEYVPGDFAPLVIDGDLATVRDALRLSDKNVQQINYSLAYYMRLLHAPDVQNFTLRFDPRYTYSFSDTAYADLRSNYVTVQSYSNAPGLKLVYNLYAYSTLSEEFRAPGTTITWALTRANDFSVALQLNAGLPKRIALKFVGGRSQNIDLVPGYLSVYFVTAAEALTDNFTFNVVLRTPPTFEPVTILKDLEDVAGNLQSVLFIPWADYAEEISALGRLWLYGREHTVKLASALLGYAYRCERLRRGVALPGRISTLRRYHV